MLKALATPGWAGAGAPAVVPGGVPPERLNAWGGSLATGHPFAATGARLLATAAARLVAGGGHGYAVVTACAAGGQGAAFLLKGVPAEAVAVIAPAAGGKAAAAGVAFARAGATAAMA